MQEMAKSLSLLAELPLPDATNVLPGHEGFSTLGQERSTNPLSLIHISACSGRVRPGW